MLNRETWAWIILTWLGFNGLVIGIVCTRGLLVKWDQARHRACIKRAMKRGMSPAQAQQWADLTHPRGRSQ